jgi:hypothetical protein
MMRPEAVEAFVAKLLVSDAVRGSEPGLTRRRVAAQLDEKYKEHATLLLLWFEAAHLLDQPVDVGQPYRRPRPLTSVDSSVIAERLKLTPCPTADDVATAKARGL